MLKYKKYQLIKLNIKNSDRINQLIIDNNGSIFHEPDLNNIIEQKFQTDLCYLVDNPDNIKNAAPVHITKNKLGFKCYNISPMGDIPYSGFIDFKEISTNDFSVNYFESIAYIGYPYIKKTEVKDGNGYGETTMVNLDLSNDEIFNKIIHSKRRNMIRKAVKKGITIKSYHTIEGLKLFWPIVKELHMKLGYLHLTYDYYEEIFRAYALKKQAFILLAFKQNKPISGVFILGNNNFMHYYKGASVFGIKNEGQGELLQWEAIKLSKTLGAKYYDLCNLNKEKLPEIYRFKTGVSKELYQYQRYTKNSVGYKIANRLTNL